MLQIIGWLGCVFLIVKAYEIGTDQARVKEDGKIQEGAAAMVVVLILSTICFGYWIFAQGKAIAEIADPYETSSTYSGEVYSEGMAAAEQAAREAEAGAKSSTGTVP